MAGWLGGGRARSGHRYSLRRIGRGTIPTALERGGNRKKSEDDKHVEKGGVDTSEHVGLRLFGLVLNTVEGLLRI